jgi:hypothetical protein
MPDFFQYYGRFQNVRGSFGSLPPWARSIVTFFAVPGLLLAGLSLILLAVSILTLFLLTVPVYRLLQAVTGGRSPAVESATAPMMPGFASSMFSTEPSASRSTSPGRKPVQVRVVE